MFERLRFRPLEIWLNYQIIFNPKLLIFECFDLTLECGDDAGVVTFNKPIHERANIILNF